MGRACIELRILAHEVSKVWWCLQMDAGNVEDEFWRIVDQGGPGVQVACALDLDTTLCGSGFPQVSAYARPTSSQKPPLL